LSTRSTGLTPVVFSVAQPSGSTNCFISFYGSFSFSSILLNRSSIDSLITGSSGKSINFSSFSGDIIIQREKTFRVGTVKVEPPVTDEVVLVEDGAIGTEEAVLGQTTLTISGTDVEHLALSLGVSIVASINLSFTRKARLRNFSKYGIILSRNSRDVVGKSS
jgi:hypothetical protein